MKLSILMCGLKSRPWQRLADKINNQIKEFPEEVEFLVDVDDGRENSGVKRNRLIVKSTGEYIAFLDDDDDVHHNYVFELLRGCYLEVDVVSFNLVFINLANPNRQEIWRFGMQPNDRKNGKMCINHLCAWRKSLATQVAWCPDLGYADDRVWFEPLCHAGLPKTHYHIDETLYRYLYSPGITANQKPARLQFTRKYLGSGLRCFFDKTTREILVEVGNTQPSPLITVRDKNNVVTRRRPSELEQYHAVKMV